MLPCWAATSCNELFITPRQTPIDRHAALVCGHTTAQKHPHTQIGVGNHNLSASRSLGLALGAWVECGKCCELAPTCTC